MKGNLVKMTALSEEAKKTLKCYGRFIEDAEDEIKLDFIGGLAYYHGWNHYVVNFENGYGASIVKKAYGRQKSESKNLEFDWVSTIGAMNDLWEIAVLYDGELEYRTPITDDVIGGLTENDVIFICGQISQLDRTPEEYYEVLGSWLDEDWLDEEG